MPELIKNKVCKNCTYREIDKGGMFCHANPPHTYPVPRALPDGTQAIGFMTIWPQVQPDTGCRMWSSIATGLGT